MARLRRRDSCGGWPSRWKTPLLWRRSCRPSPLSLPPFFLRGAHTGSQTVGPSNGNDCVQQKRVVCFRWIKFGLRSGTILRPVDHVRSSGLRKIGCGLVVDHRRERLVASSMVARWWPAEAISLHELRTELHSVVQASARAQGLSRALGRARPRSPGRGPETLP